VRKPCSGAAARSTACLPAECGADSTPDCGASLALRLWSPCRRVDPVMSPPADAAPSDRWAVAAADHVQRPPLGWLDSPWVVQRYVFPLLFDEVVSDRWGANAVHNFGVPAGGHWLSVGCGGANIEMQMSEDGLFSRMDAYDPSAGAVEVAREQARQRGITNIRFHVADLNTLTLATETFDVAHVNMALHHCGALEHLVWQVNRSLVPGGLFLVNEFVGPNQFQYPDSQVDIVNDLLALIPERLRWNPVAKEVKTEYPRFTRQFWNDWDPTESIRSDEIPRVLKLNFPELRRHDYNGNILNLLLENIVQNFELEENKDDRQIMDALMQFERDLITNRVFTSDFSYFVCPKGTGAARLAGRFSAAVDVRRRVTMAVRTRALEERA
jgi:ubiquinone/menaquinone biosynthesis C-methylase UbiE